MSSDFSRCLSLLRQERGVSQRSAAKDLGITNGSNGYFLPEQPLTRQDAMVMVRRAMQAAGWNLSASNHSYLSGFADGAYISLYARAPWR